MASSSASASTGGANGSAPIAGVSRQEASTLVRQVNRLLNRQLSSVCQVNGVKSTGIKAELQNRIANLIQEAVNANDQLRFQQIRQSVNNVIANATPGGSGSRNVNMPPISAPVSMPFHNNHSSGSKGYLANYATTAAPRLSFKSSPFYQIEGSVMDVRTCEAMSQHRNSVTLPIKVNDYPILQQCVNDKSYRVMVFCAGESQGVQDIAFPHQSELRVNGGDVKANLRGLKNKPGSTRPVDITSALRLKQNYLNNLEFTYALTTKRFYLVLNVCKVTSVDELVTRISNGKRIPKNSVIEEFTKKAQDPDVVATSQVLSLKCPLSYMRLGLPCRGLSCTHIQCFDATSYLQLQEQGPQWLCPICNKSAPFEQLAVDEYVRDILAQTPQSLETVTIEPDGVWHIKKAEDDSRSQPNGNSFDDDDDDLEISEITPIGNGSRRLETPKMPTPSTSTPMSGGRDGSASAPRGMASTSGKRPAAAVIDLTLSDDDDDEPLQRPTKRQSTAVNGYDGPSNLDFLDEQFGYD